MLDENKLRDFILRKKNDLVKIGPYWLPKDIYCTRSISKFIRTEDYRSNSLNSISYLEERFINMIPSSEKYIREFPIPIFDRKLWVNICNIHRIYDDDEVINKSVLWIDFLFPYRGFIAEIDGSQHMKDFTQFKIDIVRDHYLEAKYGIKTYRFNLYI